MSLSRLTRTLPLATGALACAALALPASADAGGFDEMRINLRAGTSPAFVRDVQSNCGQFYVKGLRLQDAATVRGAEEGVLDTAARRGEARAVAAEWAIGPSQGTWVRFADLGVRLDGARAYVTAIVTRSRGIPRGARQRIATIRDAKIDSGLLAGITNTNRTRITGRLALLAPMTRAIQRLPCRNRNRGRARRRMAVGYVAGRVQVEQRPERASGIEGTAQLSVGIEPPGSVTVQPNGGAQPGGPVGRDEEGLGQDGRVTAPISAGLPVPMVCNLGTECSPSGGAYTVGGGFDLVSGSARASVTDIVVRSTGTTIQDAMRTITANVNGSPVTLAADAAPDVEFGSEEFNQRVSAILGTQVTGRMGLQPRFTRTGPAT